MTSPWLTVVLPVHNGELYLETALQSLAVQNDKDIECVVVDSSDSNGCLDIVERFAHILTLDAHRRPDLKPWTEKTNFAVSIARAETICMLHQDDMWLPGRAAALRRRVQVLPNAIMHLNPSLIVDQKGRRMGQWRCPLPVASKAVPADLLLERLMVQNFVAIPAPAINRDAFLRVGGMDEALWYTADWDLYLKLACAGPVYYAPEALTCFRVHGDSQTMTGSRSPADFRTQMEIVLERHAGRLPKGRRARIVQAARASIDVNVALAVANHRGEWMELSQAVSSVAALGPTGIWRYLRDSRLVERVAPRLRARFGRHL